MRQFGDVNRTDTALSQEGRPVVSEVLVKDPVADVVRKEVLYFDGSAKSKRDLGIDSVEELVSHSSVTHTTKVLTGPVDLSCRGWRRLGSGTRPPSPTCRR